ncbi:MAG: phosphopantothenoylcysteine decarboxylase [Phycisphaerae bacterium]
MLKFLITAGPTREYIDPVRFLSNDSSGQMGFALAEAAHHAGHSVTLVHGPVASVPPAEVALIPVVTALEMESACQREWPGHDVLIMTAAVADYRPAKTFATKHKRAGANWMLELTPNPDIVAGLSRKKRPDQILVGFALEDRDQHRNAEKKLVEKGLAAIVLNHPAAIGSTENEIEICLGPGNWSPRRRGSKKDLAKELVVLAAHLHTAVGPAAAPLDSR